MSGTGRRPRINPLIAGFAAGVFIAVVVGLMATINLQYGAPWASTHTLTARVSDADSMAVGSDVRIAGRLVGQVVSVQAGGDHSTITFHVYSSDWPLPADTSASVRLATLLGQKYVQLNPGHSSQQIADGAMIGQTKPVVDFDQILNTFDKPTRDALTSLIRTVAGGVQNQEGTIQQLIPDLSDLSVHSNVPTQEFVTRNTEINAILTNLGITADQLNQSRDDLAGVIDNLNSVNAALASSEGKALKAYISNTDTLNVTTNAVLGSGYAAKLDNGLNQVGTFAHYLNQLLAHLIPQSRSALQPVAGAEPSDFVKDAFPGGSQAIPLRSGIDLIYEIGTATSQGYGSHNFGTSGAPDFQGNFFLRQNDGGFDPCLFTTPGCIWGQTSGQAVTHSASAPAAAPQVSAPPLPLPTPPPITAPTPGCGLQPGCGGGGHCVPMPTQPCPSSSPGPSPPHGGTPPTPSPSPSASAATAQQASDDIQIGGFWFNFWDSFFSARYR